MTESSILDTLEESTEDNSNISSLFKLPIEETEEEDGLTTQELLRSSWTTAPSDSESSSNDEVTTEGFRMISFRNGGEFD